MPTLNDEILAWVYDCARSGMTKEEIYTSYSLDPDTLTLTERIYFDEQYNFARGVGIKQMGESLFQHASSSKNGLQACATYLRLFSHEYAKLNLPDDDSSPTSFSFNFKDAK